MFSYTAIAVKIFGSAATKYENQFEFVRPVLKMADIDKTLKAYISLVFFAATAALIAGIGASLYISLFLLEDAVMRIMLPVVMSLVLPAGVFGMMMYYPTFKANSRKKNIETNIPFVLTHMGSIAESGVPPYVVFRLVGQFKEYGEVAKEFRKVSRNVDVYGVDPLSALKSVANNSPSEMFKQVIMGLVTTTESGGNIKGYLRSSGEHALFEWKARREKFLEQLSTYAEMYTGLMIAAPLFIISLFTVMGMIQPTLAGFSILDLTKLSIWVIVPLMNLGFLMFLKGVEVEI